MISFFNKMGNSWIAKGIFFLLGVSMLAFWGLGGISNTTGVDGTALTVGRRAISIQHLSQVFEQERNKMSKISGVYISPKQAIQAGLLDQVVQLLAERELNAQIQEDIGLIASDNAVRKYIERNPIFADNLGKFDANLFYTYLSQLNMTQTELAQQMRSELAYQHLTRTIENATPRNEALLKSVALVKKEKREVEGVFIRKENISVPTPDEQTLKDYYEAYMENFIVPEYRTLRVVSLSAKDFSGENSYDRMYGVARQLEDLLGEGKTLIDACNELKINTGKIVTVDVSGKDSQGKVALEKIKPLLVEAFSLEEGESTALLDVENGFVIAGVEKIIPQSYKKYASVKEEVAQLWKTEQQKSALPKIVEDLVASVKKGQGWKGYEPVTEILSQTESKKFPKTIVPALLQQKEGKENVASYPVENGEWVAYIKRIIPAKTEPTKSELSESFQDLNKDLLEAVQKAYAQRYQIKIHQSTIQKAFSIYDNQED